MRELQIEDEMRMRPELHHILKQLQETEETGIVDVRKNEGSDKTI